MKKINLMKLASLAIALMATSTLFAQGILDVRFNEILVKNSNSLVNKEGEKSGWIEFTNIGYSTVDLSGCKLVKKSSSGEVTHLIPKGLNYTSLAPQNYVILNVNAKEEAPFAALFDLADATELVLYDASGKIIIDKVELDPNSFREDISLGRAFVPRGTLADRNADTNFEARVKTMVPTDRMTPGYSNFRAPEESRSEAFRRTDPFGIGMAVIAMSVVFLALLCLFGVFAQVGTWMQNIEKKKDAKNAKPTSSDDSVVATASVGAPDGEILAAIGYAIKMYNDELNESEARVLTINRTVKAYSPWSSKIYGLTQLPNRK